MQLSRLLLHSVLEAIILGSMGSLQGLLEVVQNLPHHYLVLHPLHVVLLLGEASPRDDDGDEVGGTS